MKMSWGNDWGKGSSGGWGSYGQNGHSSSGHKNAERTHSSDCTVGRGMWGNSGSVSERPANNWSVCQHDRALKCVGNGN
ncbi:hypothetical protein DPMN_179683 [Dreissena polymorpha]|uniref:Uncharacterized protein n=1 Tax=Dreissena polymorpha TaxID=45954 RepID=A0A9D4EF80_DREPO|nr:hypothetical protein DPMN_179683 [Dreissena polymorpha]